MDITYLLLPVFILAIVGYGWTGQVAKPTGNDIDDDDEILLKRLEDTLHASDLDKKELEDLEGVEDIKMAKKLKRVKRWWWWTRLDHTKKTAGGKKGDSERVGNETAAA